MSERRRGAVYLVCWAATPYKHAGHYLGFAYPATPDHADPAILTEVRAALQTRITCRYLTSWQAAGVALRIAQHRSGTGARLLAVVSAAQTGFRIVRVWASATEGHEKALKDLNDRRGLCPVCTPGTRAGNVIIPRRYRRTRTRHPATTDRRPYMQDTYDIDLTRMDDDGYDCAITTSPVERQADITAKRMEREIIADPFPELAGAEWRPYRPVTAGQATRA